MAFLLLLVLVLLGVLVVLVQRRREWAAGRHRAEPRLRERTLFDLQPDDILQGDGRDWVVEERLLSDDSSFQWLEYALRDGAERRWLVVCEDDWLEVDWLEPISLTPVLPLPAAIDRQGQQYLLEEEGTAWISRTQAAMNRRLGTCRYADFTGPGQRRLCVERWSSSARSDGQARPAEIEVTAGRRIEPLSLSLLPGNGQPVYR